METQHFANKNSKMFKIGNNVYKILNDGTVYTSVSNFNKLKNLNISLENVPQFVSLP